jgi:hypothetical protein
VAGPSYHGRTHLPGGTDPIPGLTLGSGSEAGVYWEQVLATSNLLAYWPLSDASDPALDVSGNARHLNVEHGTPTYQQTGPFPATTYPYSITFNGTAGASGTRESLQYAPGSGTTFAFGGNDPITVEILAYPTSLPGGFTTGSMIWLGSGLNTIRFLVWGAAQANAGKVQFKGVTSTPILNLNDWTHVAATFDGATVNIYFDGDLVGTGADTGESAGTNAVEVGGGLYTGSSQTDAFQGSLAHAAVYNVALTEDQIAAHANSFVLGGDEPAGYVWTADGSGGASWEPPTIEVTY